MRPRWLSLDSIVAIHAETIGATGGAPGVREADLLASAIDRPRNLHVYGDNPSLFDLAAAYCTGIVRNHPFVDGNKRTGLLAAVAFLDRNGYRLVPDEAEIVVVLMGLAAGEVDEAVVARWLADSATPAPR